MQQAMYLMAKCIQQSLEDAKCLEPEQFLGYTMRFEFNDLQDQLDELREMVFRLQEYSFRKHDKLSEMSNTVRGL